MTVGELVSSPPDAISACLTACITTCNKIDLTFVSVILDPVDALDRTDKSDKRTPAVAFRWQRRGIGQALVESTGRD